MKYGPLKTATAIVGLLTGIVAAVYVLGGLVIALRLLFDHFSIQGAVTVVGQLPRESVVTMALLEVLAPAVGIGLLAAMLYAFARSDFIAVVGRFLRWVLAPVRRLIKKLRGGLVRVTPAVLHRGLAWLHAKRRSILFWTGVALVTALGAVPALREGYLADDLSPLLAPGAFAAALTLAVTVVAWRRFRGWSRSPSWSGADKTLAFGCIWAAIAVVPVLMLSGAKPFESAQVCGVGDQLPTKGRLIGETSNRVLFEEEFGKEASVIAFPSDKVTLSEAGDLSSTLLCPQPPGQRTLAKVAEAKMGSHGGEAEVKLAMTLRPRLRFDSKEPWRPIAVDSFVAEHFPSGDTEQACWFAPMRCEPLTGLDELSRGPEAPEYIEIEGHKDDVTTYHPPRPKLCHQGKAVDCNEGWRAVIYYRRTSHEGRWYWDYWWFYRFNDYVGDFNECDFYCADHEGDWEGMTVITTAAPKPEILGAIYAAHKDRILVEGKLLPLSGGHPLAYVAEGTHATYPYSCAKSDCHQFSHLPEDRFDGEIAWGENDDAECEQWECVQSLPEVAPEDEAAIPLARDWAAWPGKWGSTCVRGCQISESSPNSPGLQTRFRCPWAPTRWARLAPQGMVSSSEPAGDTERLVALCTAQRGGE